MYDQIANIHWIIEKAREFQKKIYFCFLDYTKAFDCVDHNKLWKILKEMGIPDHLTYLREICMQVKKQQLEMDMEQETGSKLGKEYVKAVYCYPVYLTYMQNTSWEMWGWMKHKLESRLPGELSITSEMQVTPPLWQKARKNQRASWWRWKRRVKKLALKLNIQKIKIMASGPICCCCCKVTSGVSSFVRPHRWQPTRLLYPWVSPGKNAGRDITNPR